MQKQSNFGPETAQAFLEYQHYSGGLRTEAFSISGTRPTWAPPEEWVGFRDEFALDPDDRVVEIIKFDSESGPISWVGVYKAAPDKIYGDRKNHAGMGLWLLGGYPKEPSLVIDALRTLLDVTQENNGASLASKAKAFLGNYLDEVVADYEVLPRPLGGLSFAQNQVFSTIARRIDDKDKNFEEQLDDFVRRLFFYIPKNEAGNSRALILLTSKADSRELAVANNEHGKFVSDLLIQLPIAVREQSQAIASLEHQLAEEKASVEELGGTKDVLEADLMSARKRANEAEGQLRDLQASLEEDDERRRFSLLQAGIAEVGNNVSHINAKLGNIRQEIVNDLRQDMRAVPVSTPTSSQPREMYANQHPMRPSKTIKSSQNSTTWHYIILVTILAVVIVSFLLLLILR